MNKKKLPLLVLFIYMFIAVLIGRVFYLQIIKHDFFKEKSKNQIKRIQKIYPNRGNIYDRNQSPITYTQSSYSAYAATPQIENKRQFAKKITHVLGGSWAALEKELKAPTHFVWLSRKLDTDTYTQLSKLDIDGLGFIKEQKRLYPKGRFAAHILGFVGIDNQGLGGLEYEHDAFLKGEAGKITIERDPRGYRLASGKKWTVPPKNGGDIITTIDEFIQFSTEKHLKNSVINFEALSGQAIVMDPQNGEILAMATYPDFNPNHSAQSDRYYKKNKNITDIVEPGSVFKVVTLAAVLEEDLYHKDSILNVPETLKLADHTIKEAHKRQEDDTSIKTITDIISESLNVGTTIMAQSLGQDKLYKYMRAFGFGEKTGIHLPGESAGLLRPVKYWSGVDIGMMSFGQGVAVTSLQMVSALSVVANGGYLLKPRIIDFKRYDDGKLIQGNPKAIRRRVISEKTASVVQDILFNTVENGTGKSVKVDGFSIAGKTGTAQKAKSNGIGYEKGAYIASFGGFFPAFNPKYCILVMVDTPQGKIYGSQVAGPVFKNIIQDIIRQKGLLPDKRMASQ